MAREPYKLPWKQRLVNLSRFPLKVLLKLAVPIFAIWGRYPSLMRTPDDPVSPFGCGTTPTASNEPTMAEIYSRFGRYVGDVVWLAWRNSGYGVAYYCKPGWLKDPSIKYERLKMEVDGRYGERKLTFWLRCPDGTWMHETQRRFGPFVLLTGYRIEPIWNGRMENLSRLARGELRAPRPGFHPNMDGRPIVSIRTKRTM
jgi:hypothetical protein